MKKKILLICLLLTGCNILTTRDPEDPENRPRNYSTPTTPDILISNLKESLKDGYLEYYLECLADPAFLNKKFKFIPTASAYQIFPVLNDWTLDGEKQYFTKLKSVITDNTPVTLTFSNQSYNPQGDSALVSADYQLTLTAKDRNFPTEYQGFVQFKIFLDRRNQWVIVEWQDIKKENFLSWSDLKGRLY
jgi:hypothetical protein